MPRRGAVFPSLGGSRINTTTNTRVEEHVEQASGPGPAGRGRWRPAGAARRHRRDPARAGGHRGVPGRGRGRSCGGRGAPAAARARPHRPAAGHHRPGRRQGPRPGPAPRARRRRLRAPLRDRRPGGVHHPGRPGRPRGPPPRPDACTAPTAGCRCTRPAISEDGGSLLPDQVRPALLWTIRLDHEGARTDVEVERALVRSRAQLDYPGRPAGDRRRHRRRVADAAQGGRRAPAGPRGGPRRGLAAAARAGGRHVRTGVDARVPQPAAGRAVERPDVAAHRLRGRVAHGLRARRLPAHPAAARPARRAAAAPHRPRARDRLAGRAALPRLHPHPRRLEAHAAPR